ncbi:MAG: hypothetical protein ACM3RX_00875 [Methanococcaceae archaeon]
MKRNKSDINWYFVIAGVLVLYFGLSGRQITESEINKITVSLSEDIINVNGRRNPTDFSLRTKEYKNRFDILNGSIPHGRYEDISNLRSGQVVDLFISTIDLEKLRSGEGDIIVRAITVNGNYLISEDEFFTNRKKYKERLMLVAAFIGIMLLLNGFMRMPAKFNYVITGTFVVSFILMRIFVIGLY